MNLASGLIALLLIKSTPCLICVANCSAIDWKLSIGTSTPAAANADASFSVSKPLVCSMSRFCQSVVAIRLFSESLTVVLISLEYFSVFGFHKNSWKALSYTPSAADFKVFETFCDITLDIDVSTPAIFASVNAFLTIVDCARANWTLKSPVSWCTMSMVYLKSKFFVNSVPILLLTSLICFIVCSTAAFNSLFWASETALYSVFFSRENPSLVEMVFIW